MLVTLAFSCEVVHKNYENPSIFVKVTAKKTSGTFFLGHGVDLIVRSDYSESEEISRAERGSNCSCRQSDERHLTVGRMKKIVRSRRDIRSY